MPPANSGSDANAAKSPPAATPHPPFTREVAMPLGIDGGIDALATKQSPGLFLPNANAFGASCLLHCVQFTRAANCRPYENQQNTVMQLYQKRAPGGCSFVLYNYTYSSVPSVGSAGGVWFHTGGSAGGVWFHIGGCWVGCCPSAVGAPGASLRQCLTALPPPL